MNQTLIKDAKIEWTDLGNGLHRKIMAYNSDMMMVKVAFTTGGIGAIHSHIHTQASYIESGVFKICIGEDVSVLHAGDAYFVPTGILHGAECLEAGILIDVFNPLREDFIN
ncbi:MAG: cupin domain-containing protein [Saprospiraceae bacterium]